MTLLERIESAAVDGSSDLAEILRQCYVLASRMGVDVLEEWVDHESNGYPSDVDLPDYRNIRVQIVGNFFDGRIQATEQVVTFAELPEEVRALYRRHEVRDSIAVVQLIAARGREVKLGVGDLASILEWRGVPCTNAWMSTSHAEYAAILNAVRNRVLKLVTSLRKKFPDVGESQEDASLDVNKLVSMTIYGGNNYISTGDDSTITTNSIIAGDIESLKAVLSQAGASSEDVAELEEAIQADGEQAEKGKFGARVAAWLGKMTTKIAAGAWKVSCDVGAKLIHEALKKHYDL